MYLGLNLSLLSFPGSVFSLSAFSVSAPARARVRRPLQRGGAPPQPYEYKYGVADDYSKYTFDKAETQDEYGNVQGSYKV